MGIEMDEAMTAIRISLGRDTTREEIEHFLTAWADIYRRNSSRTNAA